MADQNSQVLSYLRRIGPVTTWLMFRRYGITRLSARIWDLRRNGHKIIAKRRQRGRKHWSQYSLAK